MTHIIPLVQSRAVCDSHGASGGDGLRWHPSTLNKSGSEERAGARLGISCSYYIYRGGSLWSAPRTARHCQHSGPS